MGKECELSGGWAVIELGVEMITKVLGIRQESFQSEGLKTSQYMFSFCFLRFVNCQIRLWDVEARVDEAFMLSIRSVIHVTSLQHYSDGIFQRVDSCGGLFTNGLEQTQLSFVFYVINIIENL